MPFANKERGLQHRRNYQKTEVGKARHLAANKAYRQRNRKKLAAHNAISKALLRGKIQKLPCFVCGSPEVEAHHADYDNPLGVIWLCSPHHKQTHAMVRNSRGST